jgi:hypothetical protein
MSGIMSGIACTAPMVTKSAAHVRRRNSWWLSELLTPGTLDVCRNSQRMKPRKPEKMLWPGQYRIRPIFGPAAQRVSTWLSLTQISQGFAWALINNHLSTWCIPLNSTTYLLTQHKMKTEFEALELNSFEPKCHSFKSSTSEGENHVNLILSLSITILSIWLGFIQQMRVGFKYIKSLLYQVI